MYKMEIKVLGMKLRVECILVSMIIGAILGLSLDMWMRHKRRYGHSRISIKLCHE